MKILKFNTINNTVKYFKDNPDNVNGIILYACNYNDYYKNCSRYINSKPYGIKIVRVV